MVWAAENRREAPEQAGAGPLLTGAMKQELSERYLPRYPTRRAALLPALHRIQREYGWIFPAAMVELADFLQISPAEVLDAASFYEQYWLKPRGKYLIQVCRSVVCEICGSGSVVQHIQRKLGIGPGQTTPDGTFTLVELECLGACDAAPAMLVNEVLYGNLTAQRIDEILASLPENPGQLKDPGVDSE